nr:uncharacterized protein LOC127316256 [Lolium perenne]
MTPTPSNFHGSLRPKQLQIDDLKREDDTKVPPSTDHGGSRDFPGANPDKKPQRHLGDAFKKGATPEAAAIAGLGQQPRQGVSPGLVAPSCFVPKTGPPSSTLPTNTSPLPGAAAPGTPPAPTTAPLQHHHGQGLPRQPAATPRPPTPEPGREPRIRPGGARHPRRRRPRTTSRHHLPEDRPPAATQQRPPPTPSAATTGSGPPSRRDHAPSRRRTSSAATTGHRRPVRRYHAALAAAAASHAATNTSDRGRRPACRFSRASHGEKTPAHLWGQGPPPPRRWPAAQQREGGSGGGGAPWRR